MKVESFQTLLGQVPSLTEGQLDELVRAVEKRLRISAIADTRFALIADTVSR
jgi:hypothetical protein